MLKRGSWASSCTCSRTGLSTWPAPKSSTTRRATLASASRHTTTDHLRPNSYAAHVTPEPVEPCGVRAPIHTKPAAADSLRGLCAAPVAAGEFIGRMPRPRGLFMVRGGPFRSDGVLRLQAS